jgi:hypothetical protein
VDSDNFKPALWTHDSELNCAVLDDELDQRAPLTPGDESHPARVYARELRLMLAQSTWTLLRPRWTPGGTAAHQHLLNGQRPVLHLLGCSALQETFGFTPM